MRRSDQPSIGAPSPVYAAFEAEEDRETAVVGSSGLCAGCVHTQRREAVEKARLIPEVDAVAVDDLLRERFRLVIGPRPDEIDALDAAIAAEAKSTVGPPEGCAALILKHAERPHENLPILLERPRR